MALYEIADVLLRLKAVKLNISQPFLWTSGIHSPIYCDNRILISYPEERKKIIQAFKAHIDQENLHPDLIAGTATAGIPWAAFLAYELNLPMVYVRPEKKGHGAGKQIEGHYSEGQRTILIEDLISTGGSALNSAQALKNEGSLNVIKVLAIFSYQFEEAERAFQSAGIPLINLTDFSALCKSAMEQKLIAEAEYRKVMEFYKDPWNWHGNSAK